MTVDNSTMLLQYLMQVEYRGVPGLHFILFYALYPSFYVLCLLDFFFYVDHCACNIFVHVIYLLFSTLSCIVLHERCYTNKVYYYYYSSMHTGETYFSVH